MDQAFSTATNVVNAALLQKYGDQRPRIDFTKHRDQALQTVPAGMSQEEQSRAIIRYLVGLVDKQQNPEIVSSVPPSSTTQLSDLPDNQNAVPNVQIEYTQQQQTKIHSSTEPAFITCSALTGSTLHAELPIGMSSLAGIFLPIQDSVLQQSSYWPVMVGTMEKTNDLTTNSLLLVHESSTKAGHYYRLNEPTDIGPTKAGNQGIKLWIKGCDNKELSFGVDAAVGARITSADIASHRRMHILTIGDISNGADMPGGVDVLDDSGNIVGKTMILYRESGDIYSIHQQQGHKHVLAIELTGGGSTPVSVCISGGSPCMVFA